MIKAIAQSHLGIILKNISLAAVLVLGLSQTAKADEANKHQDLRVSCNPTVNQASKLNCSFNTLPPEVEQNADTVAQGNRGRRRKSKVQGYYGGFSLGAIIPSGGVSFSNSELISGLSDIDFSTGFAGSAFGGIKFSQNFGAELEFLLGIGSGDSDDFDQSFDDLYDPIREIANQSAGLLTAEGDLTAEVDYSAFAFYVSPRFELPISNKFKVFVSPGVGISQTNVDYEANSDASVGRTASSGDAATDAEFDQTADDFNTLLANANSDRDSSQTGFSFKINAGAAYQISNAIEIFGQVRYVTLPTESNDEFDVDSLNSFLGQAGLTFNF